MTLSSWLEGIQRQGLGGRLWTAAALARLRTRPPRRSCRRRNAGTSGRTHPCVPAEVLEERVLLSPGDISFQSATGRILVEGTSANDNAAVTFADATRIRVTLNATQRLFDRAVVRQLVFYGGSGDDRFFNETNIASTLYGGTGHDVLIGGSGNDLLAGDGGNDCLMGGDGSDTLLGHAGRDSLFGGNGDDQLEGAGGSDFADGQAGHDLIQGQGSHADTLIGGPGNDTLNGGFGNDILTGGAGNDKLVGGEGLDRLVEEGDADFVMTAKTLVGLGKDTLTGIAQIRLVGGPGPNLMDLRLSTVPVTLLGGDGADTLMGGELADVLYGEGGDDLIDGRGGNDTIWGDDGRDCLLGGVEEDKIVGGDGEDTLDGGEGADSLQGQLGDDLLRGGAGDDLLDGGSGHDLLVGGADHDLLRGGNDRDWLIGGSGVDTLRGGDGEDILVGGSTSFDANSTALKALLAQWVSSTSYAERVAVLSDVALALHLQSDTTVRDDFVVDDLMGQQGLDWFFVPGVQGSPLLDRVRDLEPDEVVNHSRQDVAAVPAFPGAAGYGAAATGGRGGRVIEVTNRHDSGPGSLRAAVEADGPRIVVFKVGGTITLDSALEIRNPNITIAGQTAPGAGITLRYSGLSGEKNQPLLGIRTSNVIIRYLRIRRGEAGGSGDSVHIYDGSSQIIFDHTSITWGTDENVDIYSGAGGAITNVTIQNSLIAEALDTGNGSALGVLISGRKDGAWRQVFDIDLHHNVLVNNTHRNPRVVSKGTKVVNNIVYNWASRAGDSEEDTIVDWIGNYFLRGPMSHQAVDRLLFHATTSPDLQTVFEDASIYIARNIAPDFGVNDSSADNWTLVRDHYIIVNKVRIELPERMRRDAPLHEAVFPVLVDTLDARFLQALLSDVGANKRLNADGTWTAALDPIDQRLLSDVAGHSGPHYDQLPTTAAQAARGYLPPDADSGYLDADRDGMPDLWEDLFGFNKLDAADGSFDDDGDGWTNIEEFLNGSHPRRFG